MPTLATSALSGEIDRAGRAAVLEGVAEQVGDHLAQAGGVPLAGEVAAVRLEAERARRVGGPHLVDHLPAERLQVHRRGRERHRRRRGPSR